MRLQLNAAGCIIASLILATSAKARMPDPPGQVKPGEKPNHEYHVHASICKGRDGRYYLVGNHGDNAPDINFWVSNDLITC